MAYPFDSDQQAAIDKFIADTKVFYTEFLDGERANAETFNKRLNELAGVLAYLNENKQRTITVGNTEPASPVQNQLWIDTSGSPAIYKYWNGTSWVEVGSTATGIDSLLDVEITSPTEGQVLKYDGTKWVNAADEAGGTIDTLNDIGDVETSGASTGQYLRYNGSKWVPSTGPLEGPGSGGSSGNSVAIYQTTQNGVLPGKRLHLSHDEDVAFKRVVSAHKWISSGPITDVSLSFDVSDSANFITEDPTKILLIAGTARLNGSRVLAKNRIVGNKNNSTVFDVAKWIRLRLDRPRQIRAARLVYYKGTELAEMQFLYNGSVISRSLLSPSATSNYPDNGPHYINDGGVSPNTWYRWAAGAGPLPHRIMLRANSLLTVDAIRIVHATKQANVHPEEFELQLTMDETAVVGDPVDSPKWFAVDIENGNPDGTEAAMTAETGGSIIVPIEGSTYTLPTYPIEKGYYITTGDGTQIFTGNWTALKAVTLTASEPLGTQLRALVSFDNRISWKTWSGVEWNDTTLENIHTTGMNKSVLESITEAQWSEVYTAGTLDFAFGLKTSDSNVSPSLDQINITAQSQGFWAPLKVGTDVDVEMYNSNTVFTNKTGSIIDMKAQVAIDLTTLPEIDGGSF